MDPSEWGPGGWKLLHSITYAQPKYPNREQQKHINRFFESLPFVLPCKKCGEHFLKFMKQYPIPSHNRTKLCRWLVDAHNNANKKNRSKLPVPIPDFTYDQANELYAYEEDILDNSMVESTCKPQWYDICKILGLVLLVLLLIGGICCWAVHRSCLGSTCVI